LAIIPRSERTNLPPGGSELPAPNITRIDIAGAKGEAVSGLGKSIQEIGILAQRANDNAEFSEKSIALISNTELELARLRQTIQDPDLYEQESKRQIEKITATAIKEIGFRNKQRFNSVVLSIKKDAEKSIINEKFGKIVDRDKASLEGVKDATIESMLTKNLTSSQAINTVELKLREMFSTGTISETSFVKELKDFTVRVKTEDFLGTYKSNPEVSVKKIETDSDLSAEQKIDILFKMSSRISKWNKELDKILKKENEGNIVRTSKLIEDDIVTDASALDTIMVGFGFDYKTRKVLKKDLIDKINGNTINDQIAFINYADDILHDPDIYSNKDIQTFGELSSVKRIQLLDLKTRILSNPIFNNPLFKEGMSAIEDEFARNFLDKIDPDKQSRKVDARLDFIDSIMKRAESGKEGLNVIIRDEITKKIQEIRTSRNSNKIGTKDEEKKGKELLQKIKKGKVTPSELNEYYDIIGK